MEPQFTHRTCTKCGVEKPVTAFYRRADGWRGDCKACISIARRRRYEREGDVLRARVAAYQKANPERVAETVRRSREKRRRIADLGEKPGEGARLHPEGL